MAIIRQIPGQNLLAGDERALYITLSEMEVLRAYRAATMMRDKIHVKTVAGVDSDTFPVIGSGSGGYHTPGTEISFHQSEHTTVKIDVDERVYSAFTTDKLETVLNYYDARKSYIDNCGYELAKAFDLNSIRSIAKATTAAHPLTGEQGGTVIQDIDIETASSYDNAKTLYFAIKAASTKFMEYNIDPMRNPNDTWCMLSPTNYMLLTDYLEMLNKDYGGSGSINGGPIPEIWGIKVVSSSLFEAGTNVDGTADYNYGTKYSVDMTDTIGLIWNKEAVGCLEAMPVTVESSYLETYLADMYVAYQAHGWGTKLATNAIQLSSAVTP